MNKWLLHGVRLEWWKCSVNWTVVMAAQPCIWGHWNDILRWWNGGFKKGFFLFPLLMYVHMCTYMCAFMCMNGSIWESHTYEVVRGQTLAFVRESWVILCCVCSARRHCSSQDLPVPFPISPTGVLELQILTQFLQLLPRLWELKFRSSNLHAKCVYHWAIS